MIGPIQAPFPSGSNFYPYQQRHGKQPRAGSGTEIEVRCFSWDTRAKGLSGGIPGLDDRSTSCSLLRNTSQLRIRAYWRGGRAIACSIEVIQNDY